MLIVVAILGVIAVLAVPSYQKAQIRSKAMAEGENLRLIESAKSQFARANPGKPIGSTADLFPFLPNGKLPVSPWGVTYENVDDLANPVTSPANGDPSKEPPVNPLSANGFNDVLASDRVYYKAPGTDAWVQPPPPPIVGTGTGTGTGTGVGTGSSPAPGTGTGTGCTGLQIAACPPNLEIDVDGFPSNSMPTCNPEEEDWHRGQKQTKNPTGSGWTDTGGGREVMDDWVPNAGGEHYENDESTDCVRWVAKGHREYITKKERTGGSPTTSSNPISATACCPAVVITTHTYPTQWTACTDDWKVSPVIVDLFATGDIDFLAPQGWQKGRQGQVSLFHTKLFEMTPNTPLRYWEWVTPKAGILVHSPDGPPTYASGANLFGDRTWNQIWKHGYEPMATLDLDKNGSLQGGELSAIWVWVDANSDAVLSSEEVVPAKSVFSMLSVRPLGGEDSYVPLGAKLVDKDGVDGAWVGSWDWWSATPSQPKQSEFIPQVSPEGPVCMYRWKQTSLMPEQKESDRYEGYFLFGILEGKLVVGSTSSLNPSKLEGNCSVLLPDEVGVYRWAFDSLESVATLNPEGILVGRSYIRNGPKSYLGTHLAWEATPVKKFEDDFAASLSMVPVSEFGGYLSGATFFYRPMTRSLVAPLKHQTLSDLVRSMGEVDP